MLIKDKIGEKINGVTLNIDIVNSCCLECPSCAIGSIGTKRKGIMSFDLFRRILDKAESEMKIRKVMMYVYSDPCMHPNLHQFIAECTARKIKTWLSTMLQITNCDFEKVIAARPTEFRISYPGLEQMSYYQSAKADPYRFQQKLAHVVTLPRHPETTWTLFFHRYKDNGHEVVKAEELAERHNLKLVVIPAIFMPLEKYVEQNYTEKDRELISRLPETPESAVKTMKRTKTCQLWKQVTIDANGDVFLCQLVYEERFKLGNFLSIPRKTFRKMMEQHPFCGDCLKVGGNVYQECYTPPVDTENPSLEANKKRRI